MERIIDRLGKYMEYKQFTDTHVQNECGLSAGTLNKARGENRDLSKKAAEAILKKFQDLNRAYLLIGQGPMVSSSPSPPIDDTGPVMVLDISCDVRGGSAFNDQVDAKPYVKRYIPFSREVARDGDCAVTIYGESMEPLYKEGSMVLIRRIDMWREYLDLGRAYIVELFDDRRMIKIVKAGSDDEHLLLTSINPAFEPQEVSKQFIRSVWMVIASVRREEI